PIVNRTGRVFASAFAQPREDKTACDGTPTWKAVHAEGLRVILECRNTCGLGFALQKHRHGDYTTLSTGFSFGGGQQRPGNFRHSKRVKRELDRLCQNWAIKRIAGYMNGAFKVSQPELFQLYADALQQLLTRHPHLRATFPPDVSVFAGAHFNMGPQTVTVSHYDTKNLGWGMCIVYVDGGFNHKQGGHLILWDLKLVIEFPAGTCIMLPSALIEHSNVPIQPDENRISFTQYSVAGLFRWVSNGFMSDLQFFENASPEEKSTWDRERSARWENGLAMLTVRVDADHSHGEDRSRGSS
ncbi:uncharacterized protein EV420DRAFT_1275821, partial [Desarmillaria tabescens]